MKLVVFDMDGTLVDSASLMVESVVASFNAVGVSAPDDKTIRSVSGLNLATGLRMLAPDASNAEIEDMADAYRNAYTQRVNDQLREPLFPGTLDALERLSRRDDILMAVATGKALRGAQRVLALHGIARYFGSVQTPDHNPSKPHPGMIDAAKEAAGAEILSTVMIGDTTHDMEMAKAASIAALGVSWGYHLPEELVAAGAQHVIDAYDEIDGAIDDLLGT